MSPVILSPLHANASGRSYLRELLYRPSDSLHIFICGVSEQISERQFAYRFDASFLRGFLMLDEGDIGPFWEQPQYVPNASSLCEVVEGSLYESFSERPGVLTVSMFEGSLGSLHEYLIATDDDCVLVLSARPPNIEELTNVAEQGAAGQPLWFPSASDALSNSNINPASDVRRHPSGASA